MKKIKLGRTAAKKTACVLTAGMMLFSAGAMTGCGGNKSESNNTAIVDQQEAAKALAYKVTDIPISGLENLYGNITAKNGLFYLISNEYEMKDDNYYGKYFIKIYDETGAETKSIPVYEQTDPNVYGGINGGLFVNDDGSVTCLLYEGSYDETTGESKESYKLLTYDSTGAKANEVDMGQLFTQEDNDNQRYFQGYIIDKQGNLIINMNKVIRVCDSTGKKLFDTTELESENAWLSNCFLTNAGVPAVMVYDYSNDTSSRVIKEIDINAQNFGKEYTPSNFNGGDLYSGSGDYLCYMSSDTGIAGLRADTLAVEPVLNLLNLGVDNSNISGFSICEDGSFLTVNNDYSGYNSTTTISKIAAVDSSEVAEKEIITLGCFNIDWSIRSQIAKFNKQSDKYTIYATSFSESNDTSDWEAALTKFNNELLAGNVPDIILLNQQMPVSSYAAKGLFTDLYELLDKDPDLKKEDFMPNVLTALETNGKLYEITPSFSVQTFAAKTSLVGSDRSITLDRAKEVMAGMGDNVQMFNNEMASSDFISNVLTYSDFVDYENGTCNFDTPEFKAFLEYAKTLPKEIDYDKLYNDNPNYWMDNENACRENRALFNNVYFYDFNSYKQTKDGYFGEDITFTGFPVTQTSSSGSILNTSSEIAISSKSKHKEGAWEFIKYVINNNISEEPVYIWDESKGEQVDTGKVAYVTSSNALPVLKDQLQKLGTQATVPNTYIDADGKEVEQENIYYIGDQEVKISKITQAEVDMLIEYFETVTKMSRYDQSIVDIVNEETALFFDGTKSVDETASIIQSRASIYMSEQY
ncbi:MAG: extracellular solute-binding protein [Oscillospiraceae bacterium]|nr:extracellular solute-binding protein [Oscillospiraceae bacterium]MDY6209371.1 extracellular solute-binding protein [Oscillospiraceae bacterium]